MNSFVRWATFACAVALATATIPVLAQDAVADDASGDRDVAREHPASPADRDPVQPARLPDFSESIALHATAASLAGGGTVLVVSALAIFLSGGAWCGGFTLLSNCNGTAYTGVALLAVGAVLVVVGLVVGIHASSVHRRTRAQREPLRAEPTAWIDGTGAGAGLVAHF